MKHSQKQIGLALATTMAFALIGLQGAGAQDGTGFVINADGIEPPDIGVAYELPVTAVAASSQQEPWPELAALLADADGIEPLDCGFANNIEAAYKAYAERRRAAKHVVARTGERR